jgi:tellurite resistance protein TerC
VFYLFGFILLITAGNLLKSEGEDNHTDSSDNIMIRISRRLFRTTDRFDGDRLFTVQHGKRVMTPMLLVMFAIGSTDLLFALDSIPAIFGLTQNDFVVFTATAFSLLGLRQLYFLLDGLLNRLVYLSYGLAAILMFIGAKLILHALHENNVPFVNQGEPVRVVEISTGLSLSVIFGVLLVTIVASLTSSWGRAQTVICAARRHATEYLHVEADPVRRTEVYAKLCAEEATLRQLPAKYRARIREEQQLVELVKEAHAEHARELAPTPDARH